MTTRRNLVLLAAGLIAVFAVVGFVVGQPRAEAAQNQAQIDLVLEVPKDVSLDELTNLVVSNIGSSGQDGVRFVVDSFFDVFYVRNIGSSGLDGVSAAFDSFFDITYELELRTIETEIVAMSLTGTFSGDLNSATLLDRVRGPSGVAGPVVNYGHVTVLK